MGSHETIDLRIDRGAARLLLDRPDSLNAWNEQFGSDAFAQKRPPEFKGS